MDKLFEFLSDFLKKNKALYFLILATTFSIFINLPFIRKNGIFSFSIKEEIDISILIIEILFIASGVTRMLVFINFTGFFLRIPIISDCIFFCGKETRLLKYRLPNFNTKIMQVLREDHYKIFLNGRLFFRLKNPNISIEKVHEEMYILEVLLFYLAKMEFLTFNFRCLNELGGEIENLNINFLNAAKGFENLKKYRSDTFITKIEINPLAKRLLDIHFYGFFWQKHKYFKYISPLKWF